MKKVIIIVIVLVIAGGGAFAYFLLPGFLASSESYAEEREFTLPVATVETLVIESNVHELAVVGGGSSKEIRVTGELQINLDEEKGKDALEKQFTLSLSKRGSRAGLKTSYSSSFIDHFTGKNAYVYVTVYLPSGLTAEIHAEKGDIFIGSVQSDVFIEYSRGETVLEDVRGRIEITDGAGNLSLARVRGDVLIEDDKGDIEVKEVAGSMEIIDTSGTIDIETVSGDVSITGRGKGDVTAAFVSGSLAINK